MANIRAQKSCLAIITQSHSEIGKCQDDTVMQEFWVEQCDGKMKELSALCKVQLQIAGQHGASNTAVRRLGTEQEREGSPEL